MDESCIPDKCITGDNMGNSYFNKRTRITASVIGSLLGLAGIVNHGIFWPIFQF